MKALLLAHVLAGGIGLGAGFVALYAAKGGTLHRRSGTIFVYSMLALCLGGLILSAVLGAAPAINIPAALITGYLVITALTTVRPADRQSRWLDLAGMAVAFTVGLTCIVLGVEAVARGGSRSGFAFPFFMFGVVGLLAGAGDVRLRRGQRRLTGAARVVRHLWRMTFALFIAVMSFFLGQADVFPDALRAPALRALPVVAVLLTMLYWLWRLRRRTSSGLVGITVREAA